METTTETVALDARSREILEYLQTPRGYGEFATWGMNRFNVAKSSPDNWLAEFKLRSGLVTGDRNGLYHISDLGKQALQNGKFERYVADLKELRRELAAGTYIPFAMRNQLQSNPPQSATPVQQTAAEALAETLVAETPSVAEQAIPVQELNEKLTTTLGPDGKIIQYGVSGNGVKILPIDVDAYLPSKPEDEYIETNGELEKIHAHLLTGLPLRRIGPAGVGKTSALEYYAWKNKIPVVTLNCHNMVDSGDLIGKFIFHNGETPFLLGVLPVAIEIANRKGVCILNLEEMNGTPQEAQKMMNSICDHRKNITVVALGRTYQLKPDVKFLVYGTMNQGNGYGGVSEINLDLQRRFTDERVGFYAPEVEKKIVLAHWNKRGIGNILSDEELTHLIEAVNDIRQSDRLLYQPSVSDVIKVGILRDAYLKAFASIEKNPKRLAEKALTIALRGTIVDRYAEKEERTLAVNRIANFMGVTVDI